MRRSYDSFLISSWSIEKKRKKEKRKDEIHPGGSQVKRNLRDKIIVERIFFFFFEINLNIEIVGGRFCANQYDGAEKWRIERGIEIGKKLVMQHNAPRAYVNNASVISLALCNMERVILQSVAEYCVFIAKPRDLRAVARERAGIDTRDRY